MIEELQAEVKKLKGDLRKAETRQPDSISGTAAKTSG